MKVKKRIAKFVHYYLSDEIFSSLIQKLSTNEITCCFCRKKINNLYSDIFIYCWEILDFLDGVNGQKSNRNSEYENQSKYNIAGFQFATQK
jgi:hypothetical protein